MATTAQQTFDRAVALADANQGVSSGASAATPAIILARLNYASASLFSRLAQDNRYFFFRKDTVASSNAALNRTADLGALTPPIERLLMDGLQLPGGAPINIVDFQDQDAAIAPRAYAQGLVMNEIGAEWGAAGVITLNVWYVYRPADFDVAGALSQTHTLPDRFTKWFDYDLALYFFQQDTGRVAADPQGFERLTAYQEAAYQDIAQYLDHVIGPMIRRFTLPVSPKGEKA